MPVLLQFLNNVAVREVAILVTPEVFAIIDNLKTSLRLLRSNVSEEASENPRGNHHSPELLVSIAKIYLIFVGSHVDNLFIAKTFLLEKLLVRHRQPLVKLIDRCPTAAGIPKESSAKVFYPGA